MLATLRAQEPVSWIEHDEVWLITTHELVDEAHRDATRFITDLETSEVRQLFGTTMLTVDGRPHRVHRRPFAGPLLRAAVEQAYAARIRALAEQLVPQQGAGAAELVGEFARPLAFALVAEVLGFAHGDRAQLEELVFAMAAADGIAVPDEVRRHAADTRRDFGGRVMATLEAAARERPDSVLSAVAGDRDAALTDQHVIDNTINMIFGAVDPTAILIATALWALLSHPDQLAAVRADRGLLANAVKEAARWHAPFAASVRYVGIDTVFHGTPMAAGDKVYLMILSANRDDRVFREPEIYDIRRADLRQSIAFGRGIHFCIGEPLAEIAAREAMDVVLSALPRLKLDPARPSEPRGVDHHQLARLDVLCDG